MILLFQIFANSYSAEYELPPDTVARPLPVVKQSLTATKSKPLRSMRPAHTKPKSKISDNDTPRAFARLMAFHQQGIKPRSGLDEGHAQKGKKRKRVGQEGENRTNGTTTVADVSGSQYTGSADDTTTLPTVKAHAHEALTIQHLKINPGERLSDFSARVDLALPVGGLVKKGRVAGVRSKLERRMQRMQNEWREMDKKRKERDQEARDELEMEDEEGTEKRSAIMPLTKNGRKNNRRKTRQGSETDDEDPWAKVGQSRVSDVGRGGLVGLHDVVQAPPNFTSVPQKKFRVLEGAKVDVLNVPGNVGSLRRREELGVSRRSVVDGYRQMMKERRMKITNR